VKMTGQGIKGGVERTVSDSQDRIEAAHTVCAGALDGACAHLTQQERLEVFRRLSGVCYRTQETMLIRLFVAAADTYIAQFAACRVRDEHATPTSTGRLQQTARDYEAMRACVMDMLK
jgi:hypothetical protein